MKVQTHSISDAAKAVIKNSTMTEKSVKLPEGRLDPKVYREIDKAFLIIGGKWNKSAKAHLFNDDPREAIKSLINDGSIVDVKKTTQAYYTPADIASTIARAIQIESGHTVLEPSAGPGALAEAARDFGGNVICCDIDDKSIGVLFNKGFQNAWHGDFLQLAETIGNKAGPIHRIIMNPPFTQQQDVQHALKAIELLAPGGKMACVMTASYKTRNTKIAKSLRDVLATLKHRTIDLPVFEGSGSSVAPICLIIEKD